MGPDSPFIVTPSGHIQSVGSASPKRLGTLGCLALVIVTLGFIVIAGCSTKIIDQAGSLQDTRTEELRDWVREDPQRDKLIVFVHGFNSSKEKAWGQFPALLKGDADFTDFNIQRFGYPTKLCRQVSDIRNQGELLAAFLTSTLQRAQPKYRQVVLLGHSMGGLVILHTLLKLERDDLPLLTEQDLKVLTFGTPYLGVESTDVLELFCENKQVNDMHVLNDTLGELAREWTQRFNQQPVSGGRDTPQVPLYAFRGTEDRFVSKTSACGYPQTPCEPVDGDHNSIVKPKDRTHLAYQKLRQLATQPGVPRTTIGKIGIWVARITGDDASHAEQRGMIERLEYFISRAEPQLSEAVEIRKLPVEIEGNTLREKEEQVKRLGLEYQAAIIVWGQVTKLAGGGEFHPRVTLVKQLRLQTKTAVLAPVSQYDSQLQQFSSPPGTISLPSQSLQQEPLQLARFVLAVTLMEQRAWAKAAQQFDFYIGATPSMAVQLADILFYAGLVNSNLASASGMLEPLTKAKNMYESARVEYAKEHDSTRYLRVQNNLGLTYQELAGRGVDPEKNIQNSLTTLMDAVRLLKEQQNWIDCAMAQNNLGLTYRVLAERGVDPEKSLQDSLLAFTEAARLHKEQGNWVSYGAVKNNFGMTYRVLAQLGFAPEKNLQNSLLALTEAAGLGYLVASQTNLGVTYRLLAQNGVDPKKNLQNSLTVLLEAARVRKVQQDWLGYATVQNNLGLTYRVLAERGVDPKQNFQNSVMHLSEAVRLFREQQNWAEYAGSQTNLGATYRMLAELGVDPEKNLQSSQTTLTDAVRLYREQKNWARYALAQTNLGATYTVLAVHQVDSEENLKNSLTVLKEASHISQEQQDWAGYAMAQNNLGISYHVLAKRGVEPQNNFQKSLTAFTEAVRLWKDQQNWSDYAMAQNNLGSTYGMMARQEIEPEGNLLRSVEALTEAARLWKDQQNWADYAMVQNNLGKVYRALAQRGVAYAENQSLANQAFSEASTYSPK